MSRKNAEVVWGAVEAWNAGDMERLRGFYDPDIVVRAFPDWPDATPGVVVGRDELMRAFARVREAWRATDALEVVGDFVTAGDRVIVRFLWKAEGHGPPMNMEFTYVYTVRKGRILELEMFWDHGDALDAVGLSE